MLHIFMGDRPAIFYILALRFIKTVSVEWVLCWEHYYYQVNKSFKRDVLNFNDILAVRLIQAFSIRGIVHFFI